MKALVMGLIVLSSVHAFASHNEEHHPCKEIKAACEAAGFKKGDHKTNGKGLYKDCLQPIAEGKSVAGVNVTAEQISSCKAKMEEKKAAK
jgi:hypothetical protein